MKHHGNNFVRILFFFSTVFSMACIFTPTTFAQTVEPKAFVYTELQLSAPFDTIPWRNINTTIKQQTGFISKTWLSGVGNNSGGGFYAFDSIENAKKFVTGYFPAEAKNFGVAQTTRVFDAAIGADASRAINSVYFGGKLIKKPAAFVYTELQVRSNPFSKKMWRTVNTKLATQPGLLSNTWLIGVHTDSRGGFFAFDTFEHAQNFALNDFPEEAKMLNAAFTARVFDATKTETASQNMASPFYTIQTQ